MRILTCLFAALISLPATAGIYRVVGPDGQVSYSDQPGPGAEEIKPSTGSTYTPVPITPAASSSNSSEPASEKLSPYTAISITQPQADETVRENSGRLEILIQLEPALITGAKHQLQVTMDGEVLPGLHLPGAPIILESVDRGTHTLEASVLSAEGEVLVSTEPLSFHMQRYSTQSPIAKEKAAKAAKEKAKKPVPAPVAAPKAN